MKFLIKYLKNLWRELGYETHFWIGAFLWCMLGGVISYSSDWGDYSLVVSFFMGFMGFIFYLLAIFSIIIIQFIYEECLESFLKKVYDKTKEETKL